jgi:hypothetical protein
MRRRGRDARDCDRAMVTVVAVSRKVDPAMLRRHSCGTDGEAGNNGYSDHVDPTPGSPDRCPRGGDDVLSGLDERPLEIDEDMNS